MPENEKNDPLGERMKTQYEHRSRFMLPRRTYTVIRVDGKAFHTLTRHCDRPFDMRLAAAMDQVAVRLCEEIQGARLAFVQSDEVSVLLADFDKITTSAWFDGNLQKTASVSASIATEAFNYAYDKTVRALFDSRAFTVPDPIEVQNYFIWRQQDATRNSISMAAQSLYSHKELHGKDSSEQQEMMFQKGVNWNDYPAGFKRGRAVVKETHMELPVGPQDSGLRTQWAVVEPPVFTRDTDWLRSRIPIHPDFVRAEGAAA